MTVHNSKGLEFDAVFVVGMEEGIFPHQRSIDDGDLDEIEEERRLCYVAMTRAKKKLTLSAAQRRRLYHSTQYNPVARFVSEIPADCLIDVSDDYAAPIAYSPRPRKKDTSRNAVRRIQAILIR